MDATVFVVLGSIALLAGTILCAFAFRIYTGEHLSEDEKAGFEAWLKKYGKAARIGSVILIVTGILLFVLVSPAGRDIGSHAAMTWTKERRETFVNNCIESSQHANKYPELTEEYCRCSVQKLTDSLSYREYAQLMTENSRKEQRLRKIRPIIRSCLEDFREDLSEDSRMAAK